MFIYCKNSIFLNLVFIRVHSKNAFVEKIPYLLLILTIFGAIYFYFVQIKLSNVYFLIDSEIKILIVI